MPDFLVDPFLKSQGQQGVSAHLLERHEIESYLLQPELFVHAGELSGRTISADQAEAAIRAAADGLRAKARRTSLETAKGVNRHLKGAERFEDADLEEEVYGWFDMLNLQSVSTIQQVFPGRETLREALRIINEGAPKDITRGQLVASISAEHIAKEIRELLTSLGEEPIHS